MLGLPTMVVAGGIYFFVILYSLSIVFRSEQLPTIVLRHYRLSNTLKNGCYATIEGRPEGFWSWLAAIFGLGTIIRLDVRKADVQRTREQLNSNSIDSVPLQNVASTHFGATRSIALLVLGIVLIGSGAAGFVLADEVKKQDGGPDLWRWIALGGLFTGLLFLAGYFLSKRILLQVETAGGRLIGIRFKPAVLGQSYVDTQEVAKVINLINVLATGDKPMLDDLD